MRQQRLLIGAALAIPLAIGGYSVAAEKDTSAASATGIVLKDTKSAPRTVRLSKMINTEVFDPQGKDVGNIKDVVFDASRERVEYLVLTQAKGIVGMREKLVALPFKAIKFGSPAEDRVHVVLNRDVLEKAPGFDDSKWPSQANAEYYRSLDTYYNTQLGAMTEQPADDEARGAAAQIPPGQAPATGDLDWSRRATKLHGRDVISPSGEDLGRISDLVLDQQTGKITYAAFKASGGNLHAIPLSTFKVDATENRLILDTSREQLKGMPAFDEDRWPAKPDPRWSKQTTVQ